MMMMTRREVKGNNSDVVADKDKGREEELHYGILSVVVYSRSIYRNALDCGIGNG